MISKNKYPQLSPRLKKIADIAKGSSCIADIGTDHGYLPVFMCINNDAKSAIACDIQKKPLLRAEKTVIKYNQEDKVSLRLGGGLDPINPNEADTVVIAGMGGLLIAQILNDGLNKINKNTKIILQPMSAVSDLREYLLTNGFLICDESLVCEKDKIYNIITVKYADKECINQSVSDIDLFVGRYLIENKPENFKEYLLKQSNKLDKIIYGLDKSKSDDNKNKINKYRALKQEIEIIKKHYKKGI